MSNFLRAVFVPAAVFQSVIVGGAYGTGREVVEYISQFGPLGGILAMGVVAVAFSLVLSVSFEFARKFAVWNYRTYLRELLGQAWVAYEILFIALLVLILAITGSAAGSVLHDRFAIPVNIGIGLMFVCVVVLNYFGRELVNRTLTVGAVVLVGVLICYFVSIFTQKSADILAAFSAYPIKPGWLQSGLTFAVYNSALVPVLIYSAAALESRGQAVSAGIFAGILGVFPAAVLHLSFLAGYPQILSESIPTYWMIEQLGFSTLLTLYVIILFATIVQTGVGVLQGFNERMDGWRSETRGAPLGKLQHAALAGGLLVLSLLLSRFGIIDLVAKGYSALAWGFFVFFTLPTLSIGVWKILRN